MYGLIIFGLTIFGAIGNRTMANAVMVASFIAGVVFAYNEGFVSSLTSVPMLQGVLPFISAGGLVVLAAIAVKDVWKDKRADTPAILAAFALASVFRLGWDPLSTLLADNVGPSLSQFLGTLG